MIRFAARLMAGAALAASVAWPAGGIAQCSSNCSVGGAGQGGVSSGGAAQGFHYEGPGSTPGFNVTNVGNNDGGRIVAYDDDGNVLGTLSGTFRDGVCRVNETGIFGDVQGLDPDC